MDERDYKAMNEELNGNFAKPVLQAVRVLNLYACLGGNRYKWDEVANIEVTAVEWDEELAKLYQERFPNDKVIVADAHQYLLDHYKEFDFIWTSPPCPSHSRVRISQKNRDSFIPLYPDLKLYEEIVFLENYFDGKYVVENVIPYYEPLIVAQKRGRHLYWCNFNLPSDIGERKMFKNMIEVGDIKQLSEFHDYDFTKYKGEQRLNKVARNLVDYEVGKKIFSIAMGVMQKSNINQPSLFGDVW
jgi:DNA (cytosine-5)-methyltransferase 1